MRVIGRHARLRLMITLQTNVCRFAGLKFMSADLCSSLIGPRQANLVLIAFASSEGSGEPVHPRSLARTSAARSYKQ